MLRLLTLFLSIFFSNDILGMSFDCENISYKIENDQVCDPMNNIYSQSIIFSFIEIKGKLMVGDSAYLIMSNQQVIVYKSKSDSKLDTLEVYFENEPSCKEIIILQAPKNCCPFDIELDTAYIGCIGVPIKIGLLKGNLIFNWIDSDRKFIGSGDSISIAKPGRYSLLAQSLTGCEKSFDFEVIFKSKPSLVLPSSFSVCEPFGDYIPINTDANTFSWALNGTKIDSAKTTKLIPTLAGNYTVTVSYFNSCPIIGTTIVTLKNALKPMLGNDIKKCASENISLAVTQLGSTTWFRNDELLPNEILKTIKITQSGTYRVRLIGPNNCFNEDTINVEIVAKPILELGNGFGLCQGEKSTILASTDASGLVWKRDGVNLLNTNIDLSINTGGQYSAMAISMELPSCIVSDTIIVTTLPRPVINNPVEFRDTIYLCPSEIGKVTLPNMLGLSYEWKLDDKILSSNNIVSFQDDGLLTYAIKNANNCFTYDTSRIVKTENTIIPIVKDRDSLCNGNSISIPIKSGFANTLTLNNAIMLNGMDGSFTIKEKGTYILQGSANYSGKSCVVRDTFILNILNVPIFELGTNDSVCGQYLIKPDLTYNSAQYQWSFNNVILDSLKSSILINKSGQYTLEIKTKESCSFRDSIKLVIFPEVTIQSLIDSIATCDSTQLTLSPSSLNANKYRWFYNGLLISSEISQQIIVKNSGSYLLQAYNERCLSNKVINVKFLKPLIISLGNDTILCDGQSITLTGPLGAKTYNWSTGELANSIQIIDLTSSKSFSLNVVSTDGCITRDSLTITPSSGLQLKLKTPIDPQCFMDTKTITVSGAKKVGWSSIDNEYKILNDTSISVLLKKDVIINGSASNICGGDTIEISLKPIKVPEVLVSNDTCIYEGKKATLLLKSDYNYQWQDHPSILSSLNQNKIDVSPDSTTTFVVTTTDSKGCKRIDSIEVCVVKLDREKFVPITVITPNGDGKNDVLIFELLDLIQPNRLVIYNRWGNIVFEKKDYQTDDELFDGTKNGELLPADVYYYVLSFEGKTYRESLTILRNQ